MRAGVNNILGTGINNILETGINNILGRDKECTGNWDKQYVENWDKQHIVYWDVTPRVQGVEPLASPESMPEAGAVKRSHAKGMDSWLVIHG